jgi:hypothetical protein
LAVARLLVNCALAVAPQFAAALDFRGRLATFDCRAAAEQYVTGCLALRARHMDYPANIQLETVGRCNAHCGFCPPWTRTVPIPMCKRRTNWLGYQASARTPIPFLMPCAQ